jgi:checkpoint serine/threonine-protein kinase
MHTPLAPGRRPEKLRFNLSLLYTEEGVEYSMPESRARSMGLLGKKWGPPPASELSTTLSSTSSTIKVDFNDDGQKTAMGARRKSVGMRSEPTVTINTKEALADVFGMYNSPDKTLKIERPGSKHAPVKKIEPTTPAGVLRQPSKELVDGNAPTTKTPGELFSVILSGLNLSNYVNAAFKPFIDENTTRKENTTPAPKVNR